MSKGIVTVIIDDQIRDEQFSQQLDTGWTVATIIERLVRQFGLPIFNMAGDSLQYDLIRSQTGHSLAHKSTPRQIGLQDGEVLQLVSPEARLLWKLIEKLKEEIRDYIKDKLKELAQQKLEELKKVLDKTKAKDPQAEQLAAEVYGKGGGMPPLVKVMLVGALIVVGLVVIVIVVGSLNNSGPSGCWCEGPDLYCEDGSIYRESPECGGGEVDCWCEGHDLHCDDGSIQRQSPECGGGEVECWCDGPDLVCSDDTVQPGSPECGAEREPRE